MNILFYLHQFPAIGGIETVTATLANYFAAKGHAVAIVSHKSKTNADVTVALDDKIKTFRMPDVEYVTKRNTVFLHRLIHELNIDVTVFQDSYAGIEKNLFSGEMDCVRIVCEHNAPFYLMWQRLLHRSFIVKVLWSLKHPFWKWRRLRQERNRRRFLYEKADRYVLLSNRFFGEFKAVTHLWDIRKLRSIPNPLLPASARPVAEKNNEIVFASTLNWDKGVQRVLPLWKRISSRFPNWRFTIVGDGEMMLWAKRYLVMNGLENVVLEGYKSDCAEYFSRAKVLVYPSSRDGWGLIIVEAMAHGCVPIAFDSYAAIRDIINDGENGVLVPAFDEEAFCAGIEEMLSDSAKWQIMSSAARVKARTFNISAVGKKWEALFAELISESTTQSVDQGHNNAVH